MLDQVPAVDRKDHAVQVLAAGHEHHRRRHIQMGPYSPTADLLDSRPGFGVQGALARRAGRPGGDLRGENSRGDRIDPYAQLHPRNLRRQHLGHMDCRRLGRVAGEVIERGPDETVDAADVDDAALVAGMRWAAAAGEQWQEGGGDEVVRGRVGAVDGGPVFEGGVGGVEEVCFCAGGVRGAAAGVLRGAVDSRVVDQDVESGLLGRDFLREAAR